jgi:hypothetical protein
MPITHHEALVIFQRSLDLFLEHECDQILSNLHEVNLCGRLSLYMQQAANHLGPPHYFADLEYNRQQGGRVKTILDEKMQVVTVSCDLILHSRGVVVHGDNLIAVEMKKTERPDSEKLSNRVRLRALTKESFDGVWSADGDTHPERVCGYLLGAFIELHRKDRFLAIEYYRNGAIYDQSVHNF